MAMRTITIDEFCKEPKYSRGVLSYKGKSVRKIWTDTPQFDPNAQLYHIYCESGHSYDVGRDAELQVIWVRGEK